MRDCKRLSGKTKTLSVELQSLDGETKTVVAGLQTRGDQVFTPTTSLLTELDSSGSPNYKHASPTGLICKMKSGSDISKTEVLNVSPHGFWLFVAGKEHFLGFDDFPWFRKASMEQLFNVEFSHGHHLYWPELDVDLDLERIEHPEKFPLVART